MSETIARYERGEPVFFYTWTPNWTVNQLALGEDIVWINVPETDDVPALEAVDGCATDPCSMGFEGNDIRVVANVEFLRAHPDVAALLSVVEIPLADIAGQNQLMQEGEDSDRDIEDQASAWLEANEDLVAEWIAFAEENADNAELVDEVIAAWQEEVAMMMEEDM
jgi:glycine betaine/proline transport system substrate-binding protein